MDIRNRVAIVTGGASGLGRAAVRELALRGARVVVLDKNVAAAKSVCEELDCDALPVELDVADAASVSAAFDTIDHEFEQIHFCISAAGISQSAKTVADGRALPLDEFRHVIAVNLVGTFDVMRQCLERFATNQPDEDRQRGVVVNVASVAATQGNKGQVAYSASKAGLVGMMRAAACDVAEIGVRIVTISPGMFATPIQATVSDKVTERMARQILNPKRLGDPAEFGHAVRHVIENNYLNATTIALDGGIRLTNP